MAQAENKFYDRDGNGYNIIGKEIRVSHNGGLGRRSVMLKIDDRSGNDLWIKEEDFRAKLESGEYSREKPKKEKADAQSGYQPIVVKPEDGDAQALPGGTRSLTRLNENAR